MRVRAPQIPSASAESLRLGESCRTTHTCMSVSHLCPRGIHSKLTHDRILTVRAANTIILLHAIMARSIMSHYTERLRLTYQY
jgi:hypothetical protein